MVDLWEELNPGVRAYLRDTATGDDRVAAGSQGEDEVSEQQPSGRDDLHTATGSRVQQDDQDGESRRRVGLREYQRLQASSSGSVDQ